MKLTALQDQAVRYTSGGMAMAERENFEVLLAGYPDLRRLVADLQEVTAAVAMADVGVELAPPEVLKAKIFWALGRPQQPRRPDGLVVTDNQGRVEWVDEGFTAMCGYTLAELKGCKPGRILQGARTDRAVNGRIRAALTGRRDCRETLVNYHKDGCPYGVEVCIGGIWDETGEPLAFVAREWRRPLGTKW